MINFYCRTCGLYVSVPGDFAGGRGFCPRCRSLLQVPRPVSPNCPDYVEGLRYFSESAAAGTPPEGQPIIATRSTGPSTKYKCSSCREEYESIRVRGWTQEACPCCGAENTPAVEDVPFPRQYGLAGASEESAAQGLAEAESWEMDGEFLVAGRSENQTSSDSVIHGLPLLAEGEADAPGLALKEARKYSPELDSELDAALSGPGAAHTDTPAELGPPSPASSREAPQWYYMLKDERCGPVTTYRLKQLLHGGKVNRSVSVWREGMDKWQPIDALDELAVKLDLAGDVSVNHEISSLQRTRKLSHGCSSMLWMFVTAVCLILLLCVTKQTFADLGKKPFLLANIVMAVVIFAVGGYGVFMWVKNRSFITRLPRRIQLRGVLGLAGLLVCLVMTLVLAAFWRGEEAVKQEKRIILQAQEVFNVLAIGDVQKSYFVVEWKKLKVNGVDFGSRFRAAPGPEERERIIEDVFNRFLETFEPTYSQEDMEPGSLKHWYVEKRELDETVVSVRIPKLEKKILFTIQGGMLVGLDIKAI